jgi:hypothetical protein
MTEANDFAFKMPVNTKKWYYELVDGRPMRLTGGSVLHELF